MLIVVFACLVDLTHAVSTTLEKRAGHANGGLKCPGQRPDQRGN